jgi:hypothetical protein
MVQQLLLACPFERTMSHVDAELLSRVCSTFWLSHQWQVLFAKAGSKRTASKSHMEELLSLDEALTEKRLVPAPDTLGLKQIFQLADKGLPDPVRLLQAAGWFCLRQQLKVL